MYSPNLEQYRTIIRRLIEDYAKIPPSHGEIEAETVIDTEKDHYELLYVGWDEQRRVHGIVIHIDIRDGKVWIQHDGTDAVIAEELVAAGIPRDAIVLGFRPAYVRQHTGFATA
jgi:hypothetical protein